MVSKPPQPSRKEDPANEAITTLEHLNRRREGLTGRARDAHNAVQAHNKLMSDLSNADTAQIMVTIPVDGEEDQVLMFDPQTGYKLKMLLAILLEPRAYQLELELREAIKNAEA